MGDLQEHEQTVREARDALRGFDNMKPLERWLRNYLPQKIPTMLFEMRWWTITRDGKTWKVESGYASDDAPNTTWHVDGRAPPPVMEIRLPKPESVKPRERVPDPLDVPSWDRRMIMRETRHPTATEVMVRMAGGPRYWRTMDYGLGMRLSDRILAMDFDDRRVAAPPPPPPTRRN